LATPGRLSWLVTASVLSSTSHSRNMGELERGENEMTTVTNGCQRAGARSMGARGAEGGAAPRPPSSPGGRLPSGKNGVPQPRIKVNSFFPASAEEQNHLQESVFVEADHPEVFRGHGQRINANRVTSFVGLASCLDGPGVGVGRGEPPASSCARSHLDGSKAGARTSARDPPVPTSGRPQRLQRHQGDVQHRCGTRRGEDIEALVAPVPRSVSAVFDALTKPDERHRRGSP